MFVDQVFLHEPLHAFGIAHMQTRSDRDKYVCINTLNIEEEAKKTLNCVKTAGKENHLK